MPSGRLKAIGTFLGGIAIGLVIAYCLSANGSSDSPTIHPTLDSSQFLTNEKLPHEETNRDNEDPMEVVKWKNEDYDSQNREDDAVATELKKQMRILCWILTSPKHIEERAIHVNATWGQRCDVLLFMSSSTNTRLKVIKLNVPEGHEYLWAKTKAALKYIYNHHLDDADWFFKADDDTYAIIENLRYSLKDQNPNDPIYFGRRIYYPDNKHTYMSGGAGYVMSREAVRRFVTIGLPNPTLCSPKEYGTEDFEIGICLEGCGVQLGDTRDKFGLQRFHPLAPWHHLVIGALPEDYWLLTRDYYQNKNGPDCCSDYTISFHYIPPHMMYTLDFFVYHIKRYGIGTCSNLDQQRSQEQHLLYSDMKIKR